MSYFLAKKVVHTVCLTLVVSVIPDDIICMIFCATCGWYGQPLGQWDVLNGLH